MGAKSRGCWHVEFCIRAEKCRNLGKKCKECIKYSNWEVKK